MPGKVIYIPTKLVEFGIRAGIMFLMGLIIGSIMTLFTPSVTLEFGTYERLEFWVTLCLVGGVGILTCDLVLDYFFDGWPIGLKALAQSVSGTIAVLIPLHMIYEPQDLPSPTIQVLLIWVIMALMVAGMFILGHQIRQNKNAALNTEAASEESGSPKILSRLPVYLQQAELYALSAEDHYVRVHTSKGEGLILMRLSDAISETSGLVGLQTHRSWWVVKSAIDDLKLKNRTATITLKNGRDMPVSRNGLKILRQAGWI